VSLRQQNKPREVPNKKPTKSSSLAEEEEENHIFSPTG
jgi:hypothetical protein